LPIADCQLEFFGRGWRAGEETIANRQLAIGNVFYLFFRKLRTSRHIKTPQKRTENGTSRGERIRQKSRTENISTHEIQITQEPRLHSSFR
jgi:hypothetical protein